MTHTKFEIARLVGARALQIKMGAPILIKPPKNVEKPLEIAKLELEEGVLPMTVRVKEEKKVKREVKVIPEIPIDEEDIVDVKEEKEEAEDFEEEVVLEETE